MKPQRPTIDDVAALAGVGRATVSRVLNSKPYVSDEIRQRVEEAVAKLGYKVNVQARVLANRSSRNLALVVPAAIGAEPNSYYHSGLELGALRASIEAGFHLSTLQPPPKGDAGRAEILEAIDSGLCGGVVLAPPFSDDMRLVEEIRARNRPVVGISPGADISAFAASVRIDDEAAGYDMGLYIGGLGHRRIAYIDAPEEHVSARRRFEGFARAMKAFGVKRADIATRRGDFTFRAGADIARGLLSDDTPPTALVCANDDMAVGAMFSAHRLGFDIPADISISGFDDTPISANVWPPLTTIHQPIQELGQRAVEMLIEEIERAARPAAGESIAHQLVERESTARPAGRPRQGAAAH